MVVVTHLPLVMCRDEQFFDLCFVLPVYFTQMAWKCEERVEDQLFKSFLNTKSMQNACFSP